MEFENIWEQAKVLFQNFGWYSIALVAGTFLVMFGLNCLYKVIFRKESLSRLRKTLSAMSVYGVAMGLIALFTFTVLKKPISFEYVLGASLPCGMLAQTMWVLYKFIRDCGIKPIIAKIKESGVIEKELKKLGLNNKLVKMIISQIDEYLKGQNVKTLDDYMKSEFVVSAKIAEYIKGFVAPEKSAEVLKLLKEKIRNEYEG